MMGARQSTPQGGVWQGQAAGSALPGTNHRKGLRKTDYIALMFGVSDSP